MQSTASSDETFEDFELIVVDDGSRDATEEMLGRVTDARLQVLQNPEPRGLAWSLNRALAGANGEFVARMDADDICLPTRLAKQVAFLSSSRNVAIAGAAAVVINDLGTAQGVWRMRERPLEVRWATLLHNPFIHPSVMIRHAALAENALTYDASLSSGQDYDLWVRLLRFAEGANLRDVLLEYRRHDLQVTRRRRDEQLEVHAAVATRAIANELPEVPLSSDLVSALHGLLSEEEDTRDVLRAAKDYVRLYLAFASRHSTNRDLEHVKARVAIDLARLASHARPPRLPCSSRHCESIRSCWFGGRAIG